MTRLFWLTLVVALATCLPIHAQQKKPPNNVTNSIGMQFAWIPPGSFAMGSPKDEIQRAADEFPHKVTLTKGFYMGIHLVTQEQWTEIMGRNPSHYIAERNLPVEQISWDDCQEFIKKLRAGDRKPYRLPSEAEWEFCCRAGTTTPFHFGETLSTDQANFNGKERPYGKSKMGVYREKTTPVGSFLANAWGLHDMHGNVAQWCYDWYGDYQPKEVIDPQGPLTGDSRVVRGGSWLYDARLCRSANRNRYVRNFRNRNLGFRVCFFVE